MYFKQLEIVGFKSFPYKTKLKFEPGITAIVGPNGCGKSNISDAIRWVLGEQSPKSLRGSAMNDVIFNGTDDVEPINMAEVTLTLSNEQRLLPIDYSEVTITRRLFRSGESEYVLNKMPVRLRDISSLLMGTGMGTNSYSIIEQGKMDLILSSKPEDRRYIFEEASGITRYKSKKREALKKLEHTENNLVRINDIINEVKRQINSIEKHAKKAEKYKIDFESMKEMDLKLAKNELHKINNVIDKEREVLAEERMKEKNMRQEIEDITGDINTCRDDMDNVIQKLSETQNKLSQTTLFIDKSTHKIGLNAERMNDLKNLKETSEKELAGLDKKVRQKEEEIEKIKERLREIAGQKDEKEKLSAQKNESVENLSREVELHKKDVKDAKDRSVDLLAFGTKTKNELIKLGADLQNRRSRLRRLETEKERVLEEKQNVDIVYVKAKSDVEAKREKVDERRKHYQDFREKVRALECELEDIRKHISEKENALNSLKSKEEILKEMIETLEGFDKGVKLIAEGARNGALKGVIGIMADMIEPERGYELALEAALGKKSQAVVVRDKIALNEAISFLGGGQSAPFIIYEDIKDAVSKNRNGLFLKRTENALSSFAKTDPSYKNMIDFLLDNTYIADSVEEAREKLEKSRENATFVTMEGFVIERGFVFGRSTKEDEVSSIIGRANRVKEMQGQKRDLEGNIRDIWEDETVKKVNLKKVKEEILSVENELKKEEINLANTLSRQDAIEQGLKKITDEISVIELEIGEVGELVHDISLKGDELNKSLNESEGEYAKTQEIISISQAAAADKTEKKNLFILEMSELKSHIGFLENTEEEVKANLEREETLFTELKSQHEEREKSVAGYDEKRALLETETENLDEEIKAKKDEEILFRENLNKIIENKDNLSRTLRERENTLRGKENALEGLKDRMRNSEITKRENELAVVNMKDRIREAYKLDIEEAQVEIDENANWEDIRNRIEVLKIKLDKLGPVNLVAIDEHKELEERYAFLTHQHEDLLSAKESLHKAITTINKTTRKLFIETFQKIQVEFRNYFRMLFGGGHAELLLLDENDILESGIEIVARPPGKKLQNLLLLSGGEKALTAIALLFAIFKVKPSPFCILDEVDASLDESNIGRFTRILQDFLKTSQFIVITHSKKTMQMANILYGITMEKKGVSKIVSVKFAEEALV